MLPADVAVLGAPLQRNAADARSASLWWLFLALAAAPLPAEVQIVVHGSTASPRRLEGYLAYDRQDRIVVQTDEAPVHLLFFWTPRRSTVVTVTDAKGAVVGEYESGRRTGSSSASPAVRSIWKPERRRPLVLRVLGSGSGTRTVGGRCMRYSFMTSPAELDLREVLDLARRWLRRHRARSAAKHAHGVETTPSGPRAEARRLVAKRRQPGCIATSLKYATPFTRSGPRALERDAALRELARDLAARLRVRGQIPGCLAGSSSKRCRVLRIRRPSAGSGSRCA